MVKTALGGMFVGTEEKTGEGRQNWCGGNGGPSSSLNTRGHPMFR